LDAGAAKKREVAQTNGMPYFRRKNGSLPAETGGLASLPYMTMVLTMVNLINIKLLMQTKEGRLERHLAHFSATYNSQLMTNHMNSS